MAACTLAWNAVFPRSAPGARHCNNGTKRDEHYHQRHCAARKSKRLSRAWPWWKSKSGQYARTRGIVAFRISKAMPRPIVSRCLAPYLPACTHQLVLCSCAFQVLEEGVRPPTFLSEICHAIMLGRAVASTRAPSASSLRTDHANFMSKYQLSASRRRGRVVHAHFSFAALACSPYRDAMAAALAAAGSVALVKTADQARAHGLMDVVRCCSSLRCLCTSSPRGPSSSIVHLSQNDGISHRDPANTIGAIKKYDECYTRCLCLVVLARVVSGRAYPRTAPPWLCSHGL